MAKDNAVLPLPVGPTITTSSESGATLPYAPGNVAPVADDGEDQNQRRDDEQTRSFGCVGVMMGTARLLVAGCHAIIVVPRMLNYAAISYVVASHQPFRANYSIRCF